MSQQLTALYSTAIIDSPLLLKPELYTPLLFKPELYLILDAPSNKSLPNAINEFFVSVAGDLKPLTLDLSLIHI